MRPERLRMSYKPVRKNNAKRDVEIQFLESVNRRIPDHLLALKALGDLYTTSGRIEEGLDVDKKLSSLCPDDSLVWYNLGCSLSLTGANDEALEALQQAVRLGYSDSAWMRKDEDLQTLRHDPRFKDILLQIDLSLAD